MNKEQWLDKVRRNQTDLRSLVATYHPSAKATLKRKLPITAPAVEKVEQEIRREIQAKKPETPTLRFDLALERANYRELYSVLSETWHGVPESTSCWQIPGFGVAVDLLDDAEQDLFE